MDCSWWVFLWNQGYFLEIISYTKGQKAHKGHLWNLYLRPAKIKWWHLMLFVITSMWMPAAFTKVIDVEQSQQRHTLGYKEKSDSIKGNTTCYKVTPWVNFAHRWMKLYALQIAYLLSSGLGRNSHSHWNPGEGKIKHFQKLLNLLSWISCDTTSQIILAVLTLWLSFLTSSSTKNIRLFT